MFFSIEQFSSHQWSMIMVATIYDNDNDADADDDDNQCRWWQLTARLPAPISTPSAGWESQEGLGSLHLGCQGHQALPSHPLAMRC